MSAEQKAAQDYSQAERSNKTVEDAAGVHGKPTVRRNGEGAPRPGSQGQPATKGPIGEPGEAANSEGDTSSVASGLQQEPDPFYDEAADDADAAWADHQRSGRVSDAVLSCPGCFTTLCIDCQRHEKYHQQYRAMFVMNCVVEDSGGDGGGGGGGEGFDPTGGGAGAGGVGRGGRRPKRSKTSSQYRRVCCEVCGTEVGALDVEEEVYHLYHVYPSNA